MDYAQALGECREIWAAREMSPPDVWFHVFRDGLAGAHLQRLLPESRRRDAHGDFWLARAASEFLALNSEGWLRAPTQHRQHASRRELWEEGEIVWGFVVYAAEESFGPAYQHASTLPATLLSSRDPDFEAAPGSLEAVSQRCWRLRSTPTGAIGWRQAQPGITEVWEGERLRTRLPRALSGHAVVDLHYLPLVRALLPGEYIQDRIIPLVLSRDDHAWILPSTHWGPTLLKAWPARG